jgi:hypothetical protein
MVEATLEDLELELWLRQRARKEIVWVTKQGIQIPINDMTDNHIINAIKYITKQDEKLEHIGDLPLL